MLLAAHKKTKPLYKLVEYRLLFHSSRQIQLSEHLDILCAQSYLDKQGSTVIRKGAFSVLEES